MKTLWAIGFILACCMFAAEVGAQDSAARAQLMKWEAKIKGYRAELEVYGGTAAQGMADDLRRSGNFYPLHHRAILDSLVSVGKTQRVAAKDMAYLRRGMALLAKEHAKVKHLLAAMRDARSYRARQKILGKLIPYIHKQLFSSIGGAGRIPLEAATAEYVPAPGVIEPHKKNGRPKWEDEMDKKEMAAALKSDCSCQTVTLARVTVLRLKPGEGVSGVGNIGWRHVTTLYDIWDDKNAPQTGPLTIPVLKHGEDLCLYFAYPQAAAYMVLEGRPKLCDVKVEIVFPWARSRTGVQRVVRQLYSVTGVGGKGMEGRKVVTNEIVLRVWPANNEIGPAGRKGHILWSFRRPTQMKGGFGRAVCKKVEFTVR